MRKWTETILAAAVVLSLFVFAAKAEVRELLEEEKVEESATHVMRVTYQDLTNTVAGNVQTGATWAVSANSGVEFISMQLVEPFADTNLPSANTNLWVKFGDGTSNGWGLSREDINTNTTATLTYLSFGNTTQKVYSAADTLDAFFMPTSTNSLSELDQGVVLLYFKLTTITDR